jgi:hypothetical protein
MAKNTKKKPADPGSKGAKAPSDYKSRDTESKTSTADNKFQKQIGKAKDTLRKG